MKSRKASLNYKSMAGIIFALLFLFSGCDNLKFFQAKKETKKQSAMPVVKGTLIARVNNMPVTLEDLEQEIETYNAKVPAERPELEIISRDDKIKYLRETMVQRLLLYQYALDKGIDRVEDIEKAIDQAKKEILVMGLLRQETANIEVSSKEIEDAYNQYKDQFKEPEERQIREISVANEQEAKDILIQLLQGADFAALAKERSRSASAKDGGDLGFIQQGKKSAQFDAVAFSEGLEVGKVSSIFKGPDGFCIVKLEAKRGGKQKTLSEMWDDIKNILLLGKQRKRIEDLYGNLTRGQAKIEVYDGAIK